MDKFQNIILKNIDELKELLNSFSEIDFEKISIIALKIIETIKSDGCIFWCGNGGSASDSQHLSAELIGKFKKNRMPYKSICLSADSVATTCIANDFGYENLFSRQLEALGGSRDLLIVLSTSGNSINIKKVLEKATSKKIQSISLLGNKGGNVKDIADYSLIINSNVTSRIQEMHSLIGHIICEIVEEELSA